MGRIQSNIGLITGVPIQDTVNQLMQVSARPRDLLISRTKSLTEQQVAVNGLTALVIAIQLAAKNLGRETLFTDRTVTSASPNVLTVAKAGVPAVGVYSFTPVRQAQTHQLLSGAFADQNAPLGSGVLNLRLGGFVDQGVELSQLNGGAGVQRGKLRLTDRSGATQTLDLQNALTITDVVAAINSAANVNIRATLEGDAIRLTDLTGATSSNLRVQEVGIGTTAADLGLQGIDVASSTALGADVFRLSSATRLSELNDGNGVRVRQGVADLEIELHDGGPPLQIAFGDFSRPESLATGTTSAAQGANAQVTVTAKQKGAAYDGVRVRFVDNASVSQGSETVAYDADKKTLTFQIDEGATTANDIVAALSASSLAATFSASVPGDGTGLVAVNDSATLGGGAAIAAPADPTLGDLLRVLNAAAPSRLKAAISSDGDRIELTDLTSGSGDFTVRSAFGGTLAESLGLDASTAGNSLQGRRLRGGLSTTLLSTLKGGQGVGTLGQVRLTDRSGASAVVDLSGSETLDDVISRLNAAGIGVKASINKARNGLELRDTTNATASHLIVESLDSTGTAEALGLEVNAAVASVNSGSLDRQVISEQTLIAKYRNGKPVKEGSFLISDVNGKVAAVNLAVIKPKTVGDLLDAINGLGLGVKAQINAQGDGVALVDTTGGSGQITVREGGSGSTAAELGLLGTSQEVVVDGVPRQVLAGTTTSRIEIGAGDTLTNVVQKINALNIGVTAAIFREGGATPYRISLVSSEAGRAGEILVDDANTNLNFVENVAARDALLVVGGTANSPGLLVASSSNTFNNLVDGLSVTVAGASTDPVSVTVSSSNKTLLTQFKLFVDKYNETITKLREYTKFDPKTNTTGILFGTGEALRVDNALGQLVSGRFLGVGKFRSLAEIGVGLKDNGQIEYDEAKLKEAFESDPEQLRAFFTTAEKGFATKMDKAIDRLAGVGNSLLVLRNNTLQDRIDANLDRIDSLTRRLDREREALLNKFYQLETSVARMQNSLNAISNIQAIAPLVSRFSR